MPVVVNARGATRRGPCGERKRVNLVLNIDPLPVHVGMLAVLATSYETAALFVGGLVGGQCSFTHDYAT